MVDTTHEAPSGGLGRDRGVLLLVAMNLWAAVVVLPFLLREEGAIPLEWVIGAISLCLAIASSWGFDSRYGWIVALIAYPLSLVLYGLLSPSGREGGVALVTATVSLAAYAATAASVVTRRPWRSVETRRLPESAPSEGELRRARVRTLVLSITTAGAFVIGVVIPSFGFQPEAWTGESRDAAHAFAAFAAGLVAVVLVSAMVGPSMRVARRSTTPQQRSGRITTLLLVAVFGTIVALIVSGVIG